MALPAADVGDSREARAYATPAQIACRDARANASAGGDPSAVRALCDRPVFDAWYRASRTADSERPTGSWAPLRTSQMPRARADAPPHPPSISPVSVMPPMALCALPSILPPAPSGWWEASHATFPTRALPPLERPPRT